MRAKFIMVLCVFALLFVSLSTAQAGAEDYTLNQCKNDLSALLETIVKNNSPSGFPPALEQPYEFSFKETAASEKDKKIGVYFKTLPQAFLVRGDKPYNPRIDKSTAPYITPQVKKLLDKKPYKLVATIICPPSRSEWNLNMLNTIHFDISMEYLHGQDTDTLIIFEDYFNEYFAPQVENLLRERPRASTPTYPPFRDYYKNDKLKDLVIEIYAYARVCGANDNICLRENSLLKRNLLPKEFWENVKIFSFEIRTAPTLYESLLGWIRIPLNPSIAFLKIGLKYFHAPGVFIETLNRLYIFSHKERVAIKLDKEAQKQSEEIIKYLKELTKNGGTGLPKGMKYIKNNF